MLTDDVTFAHNGSTHACDSTNIQPTPKPNRENRDPRRDIRDLVQIEIPRRRTNDATYDV